MGHSSKWGGAKEGAGHFGNGVNIGDTSFFMGCPSRITLAVNPDQEEGEGVIKRELALV